MKDLFQKIIYFILCPIILIDFLFEPFIGDVRIFFGTAFMTDAMGGIDAAWELKPPGNRVLFYLLSKLPGTGLQFEIAVKCVCAVVAILIIWYFAKQVSEKYTVDYDIVFILSFLSVFAISDYVMLETEWFCLLLMMLMIGLWLEEKYWCWFIVGCLSLPLILLKGISILFLGTVFAIVHLIDKRGFTQDLVFWEGCVCGAIGFFALWLTIFPHMIADFFLSAATNFAELTPILYRLLDFPTTFMAAGLDIPVLICGILAAFFVLIYFLLNDTRATFWLALAWFFPCLSIFLQGEFYYYQYLPLVIPAIFTILYVSKQPGKWKAAWFYCLIIAMIIWPVTATGWSAMIGDYRFTYWAQHDAEANMLNAEYNLSGQPQILYLDPGYFSYYIRTPNAGRYTYPLPVERAMPNWNLSGYPGYQENLHDILNYNGEYIVSLDWWVFENMTPDKQLIQEKLNDSYNRVFIDYWSIWQRKPGQ